MFFGDVVRIFIIFFLLVFHNLALGCSGHGKSIEEHFDNASKIFRGRIINSQPANVEGDKNNISNGISISHEITILTSVSFKGEVALIEKAYVDSSSCGIRTDRENNKEWVFYINPYGYTGQLTGSFTLYILQKQSGEIVGVGGEDTLIKLKQLSEKKHNKPLKQDK